MGEMSIWCSHTPVNLQKDSQLLLQQLILASSWVNHAFCSYNSRTSSEDCRTIDLMWFYISGDYISGYLVLELRQKVLLKVDLKSFISEMRDTKFCTGHHSTQFVWHCELGITLHSLCGIVNWASLYTVCVALWTGHHSTQFVWHYALDITTQ